jgi:hypothetical protein
MICIIRSGANPSHGRQIYCIHITHSCHTLTSGATDDPISSVSNLTNDISGYTARSLVETRALVTTYATHGMGADLTQAAWPRLHQVFADHDTS